MKMNQTMALVALLAGGLLAGSALQAQDTPTNQPPAAVPGGGPGGPRGIRPLSPEKIGKELALSDDQTTKFKAVMEDQRKQMMDLRGDTSVAPQDKRAKSKTIRDATNAKLKEIFTPEQYEKYLKLMPGPRNRPAAPPAGAAAAAPAPTAPPKE